MTPCGVTRSHSNSCSTGLRAAAASDADGGACPPPRGVRVGEAASESRSAANVDLRLATSHSSPSLPSQSLASATPLGKSSVGSGGSPPRSDASSTLTRAFEASR